MICSVVDFQSAESTVEQLLEAEFACDELDLGVGLAIWRSEHFGRGTPARLSRLAAHHSSSTPSRLSVLRFGWE